MIIYFVDSQCCDVDYKALLDNATEETKIYVFYTKHQFTKLEQKGYEYDLKDYMDRITFVKCASTLKVYYIELGAYISKICEENRNAKFWIVSYTKALKSFASYWETTNGIDICKTTNVPMAHAKRKEQFKDLKRRGLSKDETFKVYVVAKDVKDEFGNLQDVYLEMVKSYGKERGIFVFNSAKDIIHEFMEEE